MKRGPEGANERLRHNRHLDASFRESCEAALATRTASTTRRPISAVEIAASVFPAKSAVRAPCQSTPETAFSTHPASFSS